MDKGKSKKYHAKAEQLANLWFKRKGDVHIEQQEVVMRNIALSPYFAGLASKYTTDKYMEWMLKSNFPLPSTHGCCIDNFSAADKEALIEILRAIDLIDKRVKNERHAYLTDMIVLIDMLSSVTKYDEAMSLAEWKLFTSQQMQTFEMNELNEKRILSGGLFYAEKYVKYVRKFVCSNEDMAEEFKQSVIEKEKLSEEENRLGREAFKAGRYLDAVEHYTKAAKISPFSYTYYGNRGQCYLKMNEPMKAIADGYRCGLLNPMWAKGVYRYSQALMEVNELEIALVVNESGLARLTIPRNMERYNISPSEIQDLEQQTKNIRDRMTRSERTDDVRKAVLKLFHFDIDAKVEPQIKPVAASLSLKDQLQAHARPKNDLKYSDSSDDVPSLVSDDDTLNSDDDLPDLVSNDESDEDTQKIKMQEKLDEEQRSLFWRHLREGSDALLAEKCRSAIVSYQKALDMIAKLSLKFFSLKKINFMIIKYSHGKAALEIGELNYIIEGRAELQNLVNDSEYKDQSFPLPYYDIALSYYEHNRFGDALDCLEKATKMSKFRRKMKPLTWPGVSTIIEETKEGKLAALLKELIEKCRNPPKPVAECYYIDCSGQCSIYYTDPDFNGFVQIQCEYRCVLNYHPNCWRKFRLNLEDRPSEKDFLLRKCTTPDCEGLIIKIAFCEKDKSWNKRRELTAKAPERIKTKKPVVKTMPSSEKKLTAKLAKKAQKLAKKEETQQTMVLEKVEFEQIVDELERIDKSRGTSVASEESKSQIGDDEIFVCDEAMTVLKKNDDDPEKLYQAPSKQSKIKKKKKDKCKKSLQIEQLLPERPGLTGDGDGDGYVNQGLTIDGDWILMQIQLKSYDTVKNLSAIRFLDESSLNEGFGDGLIKAFGVVPDSEDAKIAETIYSFFLEYFEANGPMFVDDSQLKDLVGDFPDEAKKLIDEKDGIAKFLLQDLKFAMIKNVLCLAKHASSARKMASRLNDDSSNPSIGGASGFYGVDDIPLFANAIDAKSHPEYSNSSTTETLNVKSDFIFHSSSSDSYSSLSSLHGAAEPITGSNNNLMKPASNNQMLKRFQPGFSNQFAPLAREGSVDDIDDIDDIDISVDSKPSKIFERELGSGSSSYKTGNSVCSSVEGSNADVGSSTISSFSGNGLHSNGQTSKMCDIETLAPCDTPLSENVGLKNSDASISSMHAHSSSKIQTQKDNDNSSNMIHDSGLLFSNTKKSKNRSKRKKSKAKDGVNFMDGVSNITSDTFLTPDQSAEVKITECNEEFVRDITKSIVDELCQHPPFSDDPHLVKKVQQQVRNDIHSSEVVELDKLTCSAFIDVAVQSGCSAMLMRTTETQTFGDELGNNSQLDEVLLRYIELQHTHTLSLKICEELKNKAMLDRMTLETQYCHEMQKLSLMNQTLEQQLHESKAREQMVKTVMSKSEEKFNSVHHQWLLATTERDNSLVELVKHKKKLEEQSTRAQNAEVSLLELKLEIGMNTLSRSLRDTEDYINRLHKVNEWYRSQGSDTPAVLFECLNQWEDAKEKITATIRSSKELFSTCIKVIKDGFAMSLTQPEFDIPKPPKKPDLLPKQYDIPLNCETRASPSLGGNSIDLHSRSSTNSLSSSPITVPQTLPQNSYLPAKQRLKTSEKPHQAPPGFSQRTLQSVQPPMTAGNAASASSTTANGEPLVGGLSKPPLLFSQKIKKRQPNKGSFEKIVVMIGKRFPKYSRPEVTTFVQAVRAAYGGSFNGLSSDDIIDAVSQLIMSKDNSVQLTSSRAASQKSDPCVICHDDLASQKTVRIDCGHIFHEQCLKKWLREQTTCPTCRKLTLLPDEFPRLG